jgi:HD superfamily phosphohydrolase
VPDTFRRCGLLRKDCREASALKHNHEFRDPIHVFVTMDSDERRVVDSRPFQRLRHIHQLAASYLVFPGATHRRFEHSMGVMHLAGEVFDVVMHPNNRHQLIRPEMPGDHQLGYWRRVVRLCGFVSRHRPSALFTCCRT